jgi:hypothetical protein
MPEKSPIGSYVIIIRHRELSWAVTKVIRTLYPDRFSKLKVPSGEHLAAILITAFLGTAPRSVDSAGETDLLFKTPQSLPGDALGRRLGLGSKPFADFEVKSLPGRFREYNATSDRAQKVRKSADAFKATVTSANAVLCEAHPTLLRAKRQLDTKERPGHSKNIFLIAHFLDHFTVECHEDKLIAHLLEGGFNRLWRHNAPRSAYRRPRPVSSSLASCVVCH